MKKILPFLSLLIFSQLAGTTTTDASDYKETRVATRFQIFVPPNNDQTARYSAIIVTAAAGTVADPCVVDLIDDGADGDVDDTLVGVELKAGESLVRYIKDGDVNDDYGSDGPWDGDYMRVESTLPVAVHIVTDSFWQHDWAPSTNGTLRGTTFYLYSSYRSRDVNVFAYEDDTRIMLRDVTQGEPLTGSGVSQIDTDAEREPLFVVDLDAGEDLWIRRGMGGGVLEAGRTYQLVATKPVTSLVGAISTNGIRDGGGFVPSANGSTVGDDYLFTVPHDAGLIREQEIRVVAFDPGVTVTLEGWDEQSGSFQNITTTTLGRFEHLDHVGGPHALFRLRAVGGVVAVFEANWLETGAIGTSDIASFVSGRYGPAGEHDFLIYMGPPGIESNTSQNGTFSHVYLFSKEGAQGVVIEDADTNGQIFSRTVDIPALGMVDVALDATEYNALDQPSLGKRPYLRVSSPSPIAAMMSNWNDNWLAYATAVVVRNPEISLIAPDTLDVGGSATITGSLANLGAVGLVNAEVRVMLPEGMSYTSATLGGAGPTRVESGTTTTLIFEVGPLAIDAVLPLSLDVTLDAAQAGSLLHIEALATGYEGGSDVSSVTDASIRVIDNSVATLSRLAATGGDASVDLTWDIAGAPSALVLEYKRASASTYQVANSTPLVYSPTGSTQQMTYTHTGVTNGVLYDYRLRAIGALGAEEVVGPVSARPVDLTPPDVPSLAVVDTSGQVVLVSQTGMESDLAGIIIQRRPLSSGTWSTLTPSVVSPSSFVDDLATIGQTYVYRARSRDFAGNASGWGAEVEATPQVPEDRTFDTILAFEDMIGPGENDWDYNDFVVRLEVSLDYGTEGLEQFSVTYEPMARGAGYIHSLEHNIAINGTWSAALITYDPSAPEVELAREDRTGSGPIAWAIFADTREALPPVVGNFSNTDARQASFESALVHKRLEVVLDQPSLDPVAPAHAPWDLYLHLPFLALPNEVHRPEFGGAVENTSYEAELAGRPLDFVIELDATQLAWPFEGYPIWRSFDHYKERALGALVNLPISPRALEASFHKFRDVPSGVCGLALPDPDRDQDGSPDCVDACEDDPDKILPGQCGCGLAEPATCARAHEIEAQTCVSLESSCAAAVSICEVDEAACPAAIVLCEQACAQWPVCSGQVTLTASGAEAAIALTAPCP